MVDSIKIPFNKVPKTSDELINQLKDRGMIIDNDDFAKDILSKVNYYRLSGYWFKFQNKYINRNTTQDKDDNNFVTKITFENIVDIYKFDSKLRSLCFDALEKIEISISTAICNYMCQTKGAYWFLDKNNICTKTFVRKQKDGNFETIIVFSYDKLIERFDKDIKENEKSSFIKNFYFKYNNDYPPYWILSQIITFGTLSKIYTVLPQLDQKNIAKNMNFTVKFLDKSLVLMSYIRNICAHYSRLWDKENSLTPINIIFKSTNKNSIYNYNFHTSNNNTNFFPVFYTIALFLKNLYPKSKWVTLVTNRIKEYQTKTNGLVSFEKMGFPKDWRELPLIKEMLLNA